MAIVVWSLSYWTAGNSANNYFEVTARSLIESGSVFLPPASAYFNELIPTEQGEVMVGMPFPLVPTLLGIKVGLTEFEVTQVGVALSAMIMYLILRSLEMSRWRATLGTILYFVSTPLLFFFVNPGYWFSAQVWAVVGCEIALLSYFYKRYVWCGVGVGVALLSRLNVGVVAAVGFFLLIAQLKKDKLLSQYFLPLTAAGISVLAWNYLRFGSIWQTGYSLIPGILSEPWYSHGIMNISYILPNLWHYLTQYDIGRGLGIVYAQPYLLLLPWLVSRKNLWLVLIGLAQFALVMVHGERGGYQLDFRYLTDGLWILFPVVASKYSGWKQLSVWLTLAVAAIVHLVLIGQFM